MVRNKDVTKYFPGKHGRMFPKFRSSPKLEHITRFYFYSPCDNKMFKQTTQLAYTFQTIINKLTVTYLRDQDMYFSSSP